MPLCPQITNTPITVSLTADFTVTNVVPVLPANTEQLAAVKVTADNAYTDAVAAAAAAAAASAIAATAVQTSANTIVNASNQLTAINGNGITVYAGSSPTSGARVVLNSSGLAGFNVGGSATLAISASTGTVEVTGGILSGGSITGTTINVPSVGSPAFSVNALGAVTATNLTLNGGQIFLNGGVFSVSSLGVVNATSGTIGGWVLSSTAISKTVGTKTLSLDSTNAIITINDSSSGILSGGGINMTAGAITGSYGAGGFSYSGGSVTSAISQTGSSLLIQGGATTSIRLSPGAGLSSTTYNVQVEGHLNTLVDSLSAGNFSTSSTNTTAGCYMSASGAIIGRRDNQIPFFANKFNASGTTEMIRLIYNGSDAGGITTTSGGVPAFRNASDYRLKQNIQSFDSAASLIKQINLRSFEFVKDPEEPQIGFIAHELAEIFPALVMGEKDAIDKDGNPVYQSILATNLIPYLTGALKEAILRIEALEGE